MVTVKKEKRMKTYEIIPTFMSKEAFFRSYPTLYYGIDGEYLAVMTPDAQLCALGLKTFPDAFKLLKRYEKHTLVEKTIHLKEKLNCVLAGTSFQHQVWSALLEIPQGKVVSYQDIARSLQRPKAVRAIGNAVGANPISPLIPCHRVVGSNGQLGGYYWGLDAKCKLLQEEGVNHYLLPLHSSERREGTFTSDGYRL